MAGASPSSCEGWGALGDSPESAPNLLLPAWLLKRDEIGYQIVLVMQVRQENESEEENVNKTRIALPSSFIIGASVETLIGQQQMRKVTASRENLGTKYLLRTNSYHIAKKLLTLKELQNETPVEVFVHPSLNSVQGITYDSDSINDDEKDIMNYLKSQGVINVRRIRKRVNGKLHNTPLLVLTL